MAKKIRRLSKIATADLGANIPFVPLLPELPQMLFKCSCDGENSDCMHCGGSGQTVTPVEMRLRRTLSLDHPSSEPFRSKREKRFDSQVSSQLSDLREKFISGLGDGPDEFVNLLKRLVEVIDKNAQYLLSDFFNKGDLKGLAKLMLGLSKSNENLRILAKAVNDTLAVYEKALADKREKTKSLPQMAPSVIENHRLAWFQCPFCNQKICDQKQHNQLFHPKLKARSRSFNKPKEKDKALPPSQPALRSKSPIGTAREQSFLAPAALTKGLPDCSNPQTGEHAMDARRTWGGRFRDTNGTFGSYPLHDDMDDESDAG